MSKKSNKSRYKRPRNYFMFDHRIYQLPAYIGLTNMASRLLIDICGLYNGFNNGDLSIPHSVMKTRGWTSSGSLDKAKTELLKTGFIYLTRLGMKYGQCALYALSWIPLDDCKVPLDTDKKAGFIALDLAKKQ